MWIAHKSLIATVVVVLVGTAFLIHPYCAELLNLQIESVPVSSPLLTPAIVSPQAVLRRQKQPQDLPFPEDDLIPISNPLPDIADESPRRLPAELVNVTFCNRTLSKSGVLCTTLTFSPTECVGSLVIRRSKGGCGNPEFPRDVAADEDSRTWIHSLGPDSFRVRLEGSEVLMVYMRHTNACVYVGDFSFTFEGRYLVEALTVMEGFHGIADYPFAQPRYAPQYLVNSFYPLECKRSRVKFDEMPAKIEELPVCSTLMESGRWIRRPPSPKMKKLPVPGVDWPVGFEKLFGIQFTKNWGNNQIWQPYDCRYPVYTQDELVDRLTGTRILFLGDSQTRSLFYPTVNALHYSRVLGNPKIVDQNPNNDGWIEFAIRQNITLRYTLDNFLANTTNEHSMHYAKIVVDPPPDVLKWDVMVTGMGNWAMCGSLIKLNIGLWPLRRYVAEIRRIGEQLKQFSERTSTRVIWHTQPSFPWIPDAYRNSARIAIFNNVSTSIMTSLGIEVFDLFSISDPMLHTAIGYPHGHFNDFHVRDNWARILLSHLSYNSGEPL